MNKEKNNSQEDENVNGFTKEEAHKERLFLARLKQDNKALTIRVENLELQIKFYNYSGQLNKILKEMNPQDSGGESTDESKNKGE